MILADEQILALLKKPLNAEAISKGVSLQKHRKVHVTGEGYANQINQLNGYESSNDYYNIDRYRQGFISLKPDDMLEAMIDYLIITDLGE